MNSSLALNGLHSDGNSDKANRCTAFGSSIHATDHDEINPTHIVAHAPLGFGPLIATQWTELILHHLRACITAGELDLNRPVDIIDLVPGSGQSSWLLLQSLLRRSSEIEGLRLRFIPVISERSWINQLRSLPEIAPHLASETLVPMLWDMQRDDACLLLPSGRRAWLPDNPCIILAHDRWARLPQRLLAVHYGKILEANLALLKSKLEPEEREKQWKTLENQRWSTDFAPLMNHYLAHFNSSPVPYPEGALFFLERLAKKASRGYFIIAAAAGCASERSLRLCSFASLIETYERNLRLPVNFHFLAYRLRQLRAKTKEVELQKGYVLQLVMQGHAQEDARLSSMEKMADVGMFHHASALSEAMHAMGMSAELDNRLALIKLSSYDPAVFSACFTPLIAAFNKAPNFDRTSWRNALEQIWANHLPTQNGDKLHSRLAPAAMHCAGWSLARRALMRGMQAVGKNATDLANLAWCEARTGQLKKAAVMATQALRLDSSNTLALEVKQRIEDRLSTWNSQWRVDIHHPSLPITLEPLDQSHAEAFLHQYRDPQISIMTDLPVLVTLGEVRKWIVEQDAEEGRIDFAIMHADMGFVGYINLAISEHASYFCFWTGVDYQGYGLATEAGRLACQYASQLGIRVMLTSAYSDNSRSVRALKKMGFIEMAVRALPPNNDRIFFSLLSENNANIDRVSELIDYYAREKLPLYFPDKATNIVSSDGVMND